MRAGKTALRRLGPACLVVAAAACGGTPPAKPPAQAQPAQPAPERPQQAAPQQPQAEAQQPQQPQPQTQPQQPPQPQQPQQPQKPQQPQVQGAGVSGPGCVIKGAFPIAKDTPIFDAPAGGRTIARFTGNHAPMQLSDVPADPLNGRSRVATSTGSGALRIDGFVQTTAIPVFTARDIPVVPGHVWITSAQKVKIVGAAPGSLTVELTVAGTQSQKARASTACDALALQRGTPVPYAIPGNGRGYLTKGGTIEILDKPGGSAVFTLQSIEGTSQLFWSTETKPGLVHVASRTDLAIDGWIRAQDLDPMKPGEMMDQYIPPQSQVTGAQLAGEKPPRVATSSRPIAIRARRDEKERPIGVIEAGAEVYIMETVAGWTNVLPKSLYVVPPEDGGFWIPSAEAP